MKPTKNESIQTWTIIELKNSQNSAKIRYKITN